MHVHFLPARLVPPKEGNGSFQMSDGRFEVIHRRQTQVFHAQPFVGRDRASVFVAEVDDAADASFGQRFRVSKETEGGASHEDGVVHLGGPFSDASREGDGKGGPKEETADHPCDGEGEHVFLVEDVEGEGGEGQRAEALLGEVGESGEEHGRSGRGGGRWRDWFYGLEERPWHASFLVGRRTRRHGGIVVVGVVVVAMVVVVVVSFAFSTRRTLMRTR